MSSTPPQRVPARSRLIVRIYVGALCGILLIAAVFWAVHHYVLEPPWVLSLQRQAVYVTDTLVVVSEKPATLARVTRRIQQELQATVTVYRADGSLLASTVDPPLAPLGREELARLAAEEAFSLGSRGRTIAAGVRRDGRLVAYGVFIPHRASAPLRDAAVDLAIILLGVAILSVLAARALTRPLGRLAAAVQALGAGHLDARVGLDRRDEFGQVGHAFDRMADRIAQLLRSQKELLANVSHELRTPLSRIKVALDLAAEGDAALARESLGEIAEDLAELERLVDDILTAARFDLAASKAGGGAPPLRREPVDARALVGKAAGRVPGAHPGRALELAIDGALPALEADPALLRRVIVNLLDNAHKYSDPGTAITLRAHGVDGRFVVEVIDHGIGIHPDDLPRVFEPFFRADRSRTRATGGVGLGLALARGIVESHGGTIDIDSRLGEGTTVRVTVPVAEVGVASAAAEA
ncbi:MAG TPA: HAMP domain-containing sensor histidine kinase [Polyangia bacterium]